MESKRGGGSRRILTCTSDITGSLSCRNSSSGQSPTPMSPSPGGSPTEPLSPHVDAPKQQQQQQPQPQPQNLSVLYRRVQQIGDGSQATVYLVEAVSPRAVPRVLAAKVFNRRSDISPDYIRREAQTLRALRSHPNIVELFGVFEEGPTLMLEYIDGGTLLKHVNTHGASDEELARTIVRPLVDALCYTHRRGYFHRDIKLENILYDERRRRSVLIDWGFSSRYIAGHYHLASLGSRSYCAPEIFQGRGYLGPEIDVWSLGVVLYALVHAQLPFVVSAGGGGGLEIDLVVARMKNRDYVLSDELSIPLQILLRRMLEPDRDRRINMHEVAESAWFTLAAAAVHH